MARAGFRVVAADYSIEAMKIVATAAAHDRLAIVPVVIDLETSFPFKASSFDLIANIGFLDRTLVPQLKSALRRGGLLFFDTFSIDQRELGHPRDPRFLLQRYELREMLADMELLRYREGLTVYSEDKRAWRATALARRLG
jgi:SAM-dependent methyltransferase